MQNVNNLQLFRSVLHY